RTAGNGIAFWLCFFSSRRRHTWWPRDWSSDVCSSDLGDDSEPEPDVAVVEEVARATLDHRHIRLRLRVVAEGDRHLDPHLPAGEIGRASCRERVQRSLRVRSFRYNHEKLPTMSALRIR